MSTNRRAFFLPLSTFALALLVTVGGAHAGPVQDGPKACINQMLAATAGQSAEGLTRLADRYFNFERAARAAASRNRLNWDKLSPADRNGYLKRVAKLVREKLAPRLFKYRGAKATFIKQWSDGGRIWVSIRVLDSQAQIAMSPSVSAENCQFQDAKAGGFTLSIIVANALQERQKAN